MTEKKHVIIGTAGHIDHGKSSLVKALTGIDPDTLPEEKQRGLTIELGFVFMDIPEYENQIVFIDVPGHEKLVKTMAAGASSIDAALLVIAADEGISVQTREHCDILNLLGIRTGVIALTKSDLVDAPRLAELTQEVRAYVRGSFLEEAPLIPVSSVTGQGVEDLRAALLDIGRRAGEPEDSGIFRLPVDRVFTLQGFGTVVAGTILGGEIRAGDKVEILPDRIPAKVRGVQVHKERRETSGIGTRTALNLLDIDKDRLRRGQCVAAPGELSPTQRIDARLRLLPHSPKELKNRERIRLHLGTDELIGRVVLLEADQMLPGESGLVQFVLESPAVTLPQDRFIIRTFSPLFTIGGGEVLNSFPARHKRCDSRALESLKKLEGSLEERVEQTLLNATTRSRSARELSLALGKNIRLIHRSLHDLGAAGKIHEIGPAKETRYLHDDGWKKLAAETLTALRSYFEKNPTRQSMPLADLQSHLLRLAGEQTIRPLLRVLADQKVLVLQESAVGLPEHQARLQPQEEELTRRLEAIFKRAGFEPPAEEDVCHEFGLSPHFFRKMMGTLIQKGRLIRLDKKVTYHRDSVEQAKRIVLEYLRQNGSITIAALKERIHSSRKYACALLEYFDSVRVTKRSGDAHVLK